MLTMISTVTTTLCCLLLVARHADAFTSTNTAAGVVRVRHHSMFAQRVHSSKALKMVATDKPPKIDNLDISVSGMFTNSSPDTKRVVPSNMEGKTKFKIVYVVLESQYQSSLTKACESINAGKEGVAVEAVGYLLEELRSAKVYEQFKEDVSNANIFIGSLIFVEELADKVLALHCLHCLSKLMDDDI